MADALFLISSVGLRKTEKILKLDEADIALLIQEGMLRIGEDAAYAMQNHAPFRTGTLSDAIQLVGRNRKTRRPNVRVGIDTAMLGDFNYLNVTRFGRRAVEAKRQRADFRPEAGRGGSRLARSYSAAPGAQGTQHRPFRAHMLAFEPGAPGSGITYRRRVRAYRPKADWVKASEEDVRESSQLIMDEITEAIDELFRGNRARGKRGGGRLVSIRRASRAGRFR